MASNYHFITRWRVRGSAAEVFEIIGAPLEYPRWWPSVYLSVRAAPNRIPPRYLLHTRGYLPYTLRWQASTLESTPPNRIAIEAHGDFEGRGIWSFVQDGEYTDVTFDWKLEAGKPLLRYLTPALRPAFEANHKWAMEQGRKSLELELARSRAETVEEMNSVPAPEGPPSLRSQSATAGVVLATGLAAGLLSRWLNPFHDF